MHLVDIISIHELLCLQPHILAPGAGLGTVSAVLWAPTRLDAEQRASLDLHNPHMLRALPEWHGNVLECG